MKIEQVAKLSPLDRLLYWIQERTEIYNKKTKGKPKPWTDDEILQSYRFCNVERENDTVTIWIRSNWREPHKDHPDLWFAMAVARLFNLPTTLERIGFPIPWNPKKLRAVADAVKNSGSNLFNSAYIVSTNGKAMDKVDYLLEYVLSPLWQNKSHIQPVYGETLATFHKKLTANIGLGSFMAAQIVADVKYVNPLLSASDWDTFAGSGPGSRRGMNRLLGKEIGIPWKESEWHANLLAVKEHVNTKLHISLHAQDIQNCLCEYDKYCRTLLDGRKPKSRYNGTN